MNDFQPPQPPVENPFEAPVGPADALSPALSSVEQHRNKYLSHEASVKSIGTLYLLGSLFWIPMGAFGVYLMIAESGGSVEILFPLLFLGLGIMQLVTAFGLRKLKPWARIVSAVLSVIGLIGVPVGTIICSYFLYLLLSKKGTMVFSPEYKEVIAATPHIKYKSSRIVIALLFLLLAFLALGIVAIFFGVG